MEIKDFGIGAVCGLLAGGVVVGGLKAIEYFKSERGQERLSQARAQLKELQAKLEEKVGKKAEPVVEPVI